MKNRPVIFAFCLLPFAFSACSAQESGSNGASSRPPGAEREFTTDFSKHSVDYDEIVSGGPPKDGIPAIDAPEYVDVAAADAWLEDREPVVLVESGDHARAFPIQILMWHELANAEVGGTRVLVSFCPLCNTAIVFERRHGDRVLDFGTTGRLRHSNMVMYDRQSESWWQQATGEAIAGELTGARLDPLPASIISWEDFKSHYTTGDVLSRNTGHSRDYGRNPYTGYDDIDESPFLYQGPDINDRLPPMARVLAVELDRDVVAYPYSMLEESQVRNDVVGNAPIVVFWHAGTASPLDTGPIAEGRDVGTAAAFSRVIDGDTLQFEFNGTSIIDTATGSEWNILGHATSGPLRGARLTPVVAINHFWFSWSVFKPETRVAD